MKTKKQWLLLLLFLPLFFFGFVFCTNFFYNQPADHLSHSTISYSPQKTRVIEVSTEKENNAVVDIKATTLPKFVINLLEDKFKNIWQVSAEERKSKVSAQVMNARGDTEIPVQTEFDESKKQLVVSPPVANKVKPGLYTLQVTVKADGEDVTLTQDFTWGVLAINTNKGIYQQNDTVNIGMAVLGDYGSTKCIAHGSITRNSAKVWLTITSPSGKVQKFSSEDNTITGSGDCADRSVTNKADFLTSMTASEVGTYRMLMEAEHFLGKRSITSQFTVQNTTPEFDIERTVYPTRIYPKVDYPVSISVIANKDYKGTVYEIAPKKLSISAINNDGVSIMHDEYQTLEWQVNFKKGKTYTLNYTIHFPPIAPEFYLMGPVTIGAFNEGREWKIASDSIFQLVQEAHNSGSGTSVSVTLDTDPTSKNLILAICSRTSNSSFNTPSGWSSAYSNSSGPRIYMYYRIAPAGMSPTITCSTSSSGIIGVQALEFSGNSTSSVRDRRSRLNNSTTCNTGAHQNSTPNLTPSNPDVLVVAAYSATNTHTVTSHTNYTDSSVSFNGSSGTFDSSWSEIVNNPPISTNDKATYDGGGGTCDNLIVSFNPTVTVSQGSYQFFENKNAVDPDTVFGETAGENTSITLNQPGYAFRLRMLLDVDSPSGTIVDVDGGDWILTYALLPPSGDCADGTYIAVGTVSDGTPIAYNPNSNSGGNNAIINATANDPTDTGYTTRLEDYAETWLSDGSEDITNHNLTLGNNQAGLFDFSLIDNTDDSTSHTYCLTMANGDGSPLDAYRNYPKVTTIPLDVNIRSGTVIQGGTIIQ